MLQYRYLAAISNQEQYLNENKKTIPDPIIINNISIGFTNAYGTKAVIVTYKENAEQPANNEVKAEGQAQPPVKKGKMHIVAIVMQKVTFVDLEDITRCMNAHLTQLNSIVDTANVCAKYLIRDRIKTSLVLYRL